MHPSTQKKHTHVCVKATEHTCNLLHTHLLIGYHHVHRQLSVWKFLCWLVTMLNRPLPTRNKSLQLGTEVSTICRSSDQLVDGISFWTQPTFLGTLQGIRMYVTPTFFSVIISYCTKKTYRGPPYSSDQARKSCTWIDIHGILLQGGFTWWLRVIL